MNSRLLKLRKLVRDKKLDAVLISSIPNIIYLTNFSYFTQIDREGFLLITKKNCYIITDGRYSEAVLKIVKDFKLIEISNTLSLKDALKKIVRDQKLAKVGIEENNLTVSEYKEFKKIFPKLIGCDLSNLRVIKDDGEISKIQKACKIGDEAFRFILSKLKIGISEKEIAFEIEFFIKKRGADISFNPTVAFDKNSSIPHHKSGEQKLRKNQIVLLDFGVKFKNYCSDMTRTVFFGKSTKKQNKIYQAVLEAQRLAIKQLNNLTIEKKIIRASNVDKVARNHIVKQGFPSIPHSLGHGIGLEVHEAPHLSPKSKDKLKEGMVFSVEPGIYIPGFGGVRIEDLIVLTKQGPKLLTHSPKHLIKL